MKIKEKVTKKDSKKISIFLLIFLFGMITFIVYIPYFREHYPIDVFRILDLGWDPYAILKIAEGRIGLFAFIKVLAEIGVSVSHITSYFQLYQILLILSLVLVVVGMVLLYTMIEKRSKQSWTGWKQVAFMLGVLCVFLHPRLVDNMLFIENVGMMIALLCAIIAAYEYTATSKRAKIIAVAVLAIGCFFYQGSINFFVPLAYLFHLLQSRKEVFSIKKEIGYIVRLFLCYGSVLVLNYLWVQGYHHMSPLIAEDRLMEYDIGYNIYYMLGNTLRCFIILQWTTFPMFLLFSYLQYRQGRSIEKKDIIQYFAILILSVIACTILNFGSVTHFANRMSFSIGACVGILGIYYLTEIARKERLGKRVKVGIICFLAMVLVIQVIGTVKTENKSVEATKQNLMVLDQIQEWVMEYEETSGNEITKVAYYFDQQIDYAYWNTSYQEAAPYPYYYQCWNIPHTLQVLLKRPLELIPKEEEQMRSFKAKNWTEFSKEQFVFQGDTLHICQF